MKRGRQRGMKGTKGCGKLKGLEPVCQMGGIVDVVDVKMIL